MHRLVFCCLLLSTSGCPSQPPAPRSPGAKGPYRWQLLSPTRFRQDFLWRQRVEARFGARRFSAEVVVQKRGEDLTLIALSPLGSKAFVIQQRGLRVESKSFAVKDLPFPPRYVLIDIQRTWMPLAPAPAPTFEGTREVQLSGEHVIERWQGGRLRERRFFASRRPSAGALTVRYQPTAIGPGDALLSNRWFGYELQITTLTAQRLKNQSPATAPAK